MIQSVSWRGTILQHPDEFDHTSPIWVSLKGPDSWIGSFRRPRISKVGKVVEMPWHLTYPMNKEETFDSHDPKQLHMSCD